MQSTFPNPYFFQLHFNSIHAGFSKIFRLEPHNAHFSHMCNTLLCNLIARYMTETVNSNVPHYTFLCFILHLPVLDPNICYDI